MLAERREAFSPLGVVTPPPIHVQTATFDGSLATLFACVRDHSIDLLDIPLYPICEAYFAYLMGMAAKDLDEAAAALAALAYLLERKAWRLLPVPEPEPEYEESFELPPPTVHEYAAVIEALNIWREKRDMLFFRSPEAGPDPYELPYKLSNVTVADLARAFERVLRRADPEPFTSIASPRRSLEEQMKTVLDGLSTEWRSLESLVPFPLARSEAVYWFLALLELVRLGKVMAQVTETDVEFALATEDRLSAEA